MCVVEMLNGRYFLSFMFAEACSNLLTLPEAVEVVLTLELDVPARRM